MVVYYKALLRGVAAHYQQSLDQPYESLPQDFQHVLLHGSGQTEIEFTFWRAGKMSRVKRPFEGGIPNLQRLYQERAKAEFHPKPAQRLHTATVLRTLPGDKRLKPEVSAVGWAVRWTGSATSRQAGRKTPQPAPDFAPAPS
jgi:excinuclease ABC subunit A